MTELWVEISQKINCRDVTSIWDGRVIVATFIIENQIVETINYIKKIRKRKPSVDCLLAHINKTTANNWDREFVEDTLNELRAKGVIDEHFKILSASADSTITPASDETTSLPGHPLTPMSTNSASTQTQTTTVLPIYSEQTIDFIVNDTKDEQMNNLNAEVKALKSVITEQPNVIKNRLKTLRVKKTYQIIRFLFNPLKKN